MKKIMLLMFILSLLCITKTAYSNWQLTFSDEFNSNTLDTTKWAQNFIFGTRTLSGNGEQQWYTDGDRYHKVSDGTLKLTAYRETTGGGLPYASGMISSHNSFSQVYGYFEARTKLPKGNGLWPAFWMLPTPANWPPEFDIMESIGSRPNWNHMNYIFNTGGGISQEGFGYDGPDFTADFHTFALEWTSTDLIWYIDGVERGRHNPSNGPPPPSGPMHMLANLAIGGGWSGPVTPETVFPAKLEIDYIRAWRKVASGGYATIPGPNDSIPTIYGPVFCGDVSGDSEVTAYDAALTAQAAVGLINLTAEQTQKADVSGDAEVSAYDAALIAQYSVGLISKFPVEG